MAFGNPVLSDMTTTERVLLASKLRSAWWKPWDGAQAPPLRTNVTQLLEEQKRLLESGTDVCTASVVQKVFGTSTDLLEVGSSGNTHLHETILQVADFVLGTFSPMLAKNGFPASVAGYVQMDQAVNALAATSKEVWELALYVLHAICFHCRSGEGPRAQNAIGRRLWSRMQGSVAVLVTTANSYLYHLALPPLERRWRSGPRTIAYVEALLRPVLLDGTRIASRVVWILGARDVLEGECAKRGYFEESGSFVEGEGVMSIYLIGDSLMLSRPCGHHVRVYSRTWTHLREGALPEPTFVVCFNSGLGNLEADAAALWLPRLADLFVLLPDVRAPPVVLTCRCEAEVRGERAAMVALGVKALMPTADPRHMRNLYSSSAADPNVVYDDNGWFVALDGSSVDIAWLSAIAHDAGRFCEEAKSHLNDNIDSETGEGGEGAEHRPAAFWGILDLKYDSGKSFEARVKILETGDGRASRFSGHGAVIKETVKRDLKLVDRLRSRAVMVENKKLTHDLIRDSGFDHLQPRQKAYLRLYSPDLVQRIQLELRLKESDICVLKLCNRQRGAGIVPIKVSVLDEALHNLLKLPQHVPDWLDAQHKEWSQRVVWGSFEEHLRHWWSNECPCFVVEELCHSQPLFLSCEGDDSQPFDGTMRVGFTLHSQIEVETPFSALFRPGSFRLQWLGGYWKLPIEDMSSPNLRDRIVSVAKRGTAPVAATELHDVYATLANVVQHIFDSSHDFSCKGLTARYADCPQLGAFIAARHACSHRNKDREKCGKLLELARQAVRKQSGPPSDFVCSYIERHFGVTEALYGNWKGAYPWFKKSLETMPTNATTIYFLGMYQLETGKPELALDDIDRSLLLDPDFKAPYVNRAVAWLRLRQYERAAKSAEAGLARHPGVPQLLFNLGTAKFGAACKEEQSSGCLATELRRQALEMLERARNCRGREMPWGEREDRIVARLQEGSSSLLVWPDEEMPRDGWRYFAWRP